jgi:hypothetical protein
VLDKRALHPVQLAVFCKALGRADLRVLVGEGEAAIGPPSVEHDGASAVLAVVAALLGGGDPKPLAQRVEERRTGIYGKTVLRAVYLDGDLLLYPHTFSCVPWPRDCRLPDRRG